MGYAIKRQPNSLNTVVASDLMRINDATDGTEKKVTAQDLATYILTGSAATGNVIEVYNITNPEYGGEVGGYWDDAFVNILNVIGESTDEEPAGGTIYFPMGDQYNFADSYTLGDRSQITLLGDGSAVNAENKKGLSRICYTGTGTHFIKIQETGSGSGESRHFTCEGLDICHSSASFTGNLIHLDSVKAAFINCRFGYDYFADNTHRYLATGIYLENGKLLYVERCNFDHLDYGYHADEQVIQKNVFHFNRCEFNVCATAGVYHADANTGNFGLFQCVFNPVRLIAGVGAAQYGAWILANGYAVTNCVFQGSQSGEMYRDTALYVGGRGTVSSCYIVGGMGCTGIKTEGGVCDIRGNHIFGSPAIRSLAGDQILTGGANYLQPPEYYTGENVSLAIAGTTVTLTDSAAVFTDGFVGQMVTISGATNAANNGIFPITGRTSGTAITYENASGVTESGAADYSIQAKQAVIFGSTGNTGSLTINWGPDRIETQNTSTFYNSYENWNNAAAQGRVILPNRAQDESDNGVLWTGGSHGIVYEATSKRWLHLTTDYTLTPYDNGRILTNYGATGTITIDIPDGQVWNGFECWVIVMEAFEVSIEPQGSTTLYVGGGPKTDLYTSTKGNMVKIFCGPSGAQWFGNNYGGWSTTP